MARTDEYPTPANGTRRSDDLPIPPVGSGSEPAPDVMTQLRNIFFSGKMAGLSGTGGALVLAAYLFGSTAVEWLDGKFKGVQASIEAQSLAITKNTEKLADLEDYLEESVRKTQQALTDYKKDSKHFRDLLEASNPGIVVPPGFARGAFEKQITPVHINESEE